jgi:hypothetical protein
VTVSVGQRTTTAPPVQPLATVVAGFEIGMLLRCVRTVSGRHEPQGTVSTSVELSRVGAAARLVTLFTVLGMPARQDSYTAGGWHRYTVHRVLCPDVDHLGLTSAWCTGYRQLCATEGSRSARQRRHRDDLAAAAWRAALLTGGLRIRCGPLAVRVTDPELAVILVRAARVLNTQVTLRSAGGRCLVEVTGRAAGTALHLLASTVRD